MVVEFWVVKNYPAYMLVGVCVVLEEAGKQFGVFVWLFGCFVVVWCVVWLEARNSGLLWATLGPICSEVGGVHIRTTTRTSLGR